MSSPKTRWLPGQVELCLGIKLLDLQQSTVSWRSSEKEKNLRSFKLNTLTFHQNICKNTWTKSSNILNIGISFLFCSPFDPPNSIASPCSTRKKNVCSSPQPWLRSNPPASSTLPSLMASSILVTWRSSNRLERISSENRPRPLETTKKTNAGCLGDVFLVVFCSFWSPCTLHISVFFCEWPSWPWPEQLWPSAGLFQQVSRGQMVAV